MKTMVVTLEEDVCSQYRRFTLYNSPYVAHDHGCAIDLYPDSDDAPSPVAGEVLETRTVNAPSKPYADPEDHLILVDTGRHIARMLHVEPEVEAGDHVEVGDSLGRLVRAGFFAPWVPNHVHLGFRTDDTNPYRASGSLPVSVDVAVTGLEWEGSGTVVEKGATWVRLDEPVNPTPGSFVGLASEGGVLDGGFPHYDGGGLLGGGRGAMVAGTEVGQVSGRDVTWHGAAVRANGRCITGLSLHCARDEFGIKLVGDVAHLSRGKEVEVTIEIES